jgi:hypothetical protein
VIGLLNKPPAARTGPEQPQVETVPAHPDQPLTPPAP